MKYIIYAAVAVLILWSVAYLIWYVHRKFKGEYGCDCGGCGICPHTRCRHRNV